MSTPKIKRAYDPPAASDGVRILVDRLWPRGIKKDAARIDAWMKELAPSDKLRKWFNHDPARWADFRKRYRAELRLAEKESLIAEVRAIARREQVTLVYAAKDERHNNAVVLAAILHRRA